MTINDIIQYTNVRFTIYPSHYSCMSRWYYYIIDSSTILVTMYFTVVMLGYDWWLCMGINISVQYSGGPLPDIILLTQGYDQWGTRLNTMYLVVALYL